MTMVKKRWKTGTILCMGVALLLLLSACSVQTQKPAGEPEETYTPGVNEFTFTVERVSGGEISDWNVGYTYDGDSISSGHRILLSLELFAFRSVQVDFVDKADSDNAYSASLVVAICDGGSGEAEITVTDSDGKASTFRVGCKVEQVGKR